MATIFRPRTLVLFVGDLAFFTFALFATLFLRTFEVPSWESFREHLQPFSILFAVWVVVFFVAGLYEVRSVILARRALSSTLLVAQSINIAVAALFFFFVPWFEISPKTILFIYLGVSFLLILFWRAYFYPWLGKEQQEAAIVVGNRPEVVELVRALAHAPFAPARVAATISPTSASLAEDIAQRVAEHQARFVIADFGDSRVAAALPKTYNLLPTGVRFFDAFELYETVFGRIPLSVLDEEWLGHNMSRDSHQLYDVVKRVMDVVAACVLGLVSLFFYPFIILAVKLHDGGPIFYRQVRVGQHNKPLYMQKFRSMSGADQGSEVLKSKLVVTPVGRVLRRTRIDELPQLWSVLKGEMSLIGPRPEFPALVEEYAKHIPYYHWRHMVKPGLSGWAQLYHDNHPHHGSDVEATREKLSFDLYYLKHRSIVLDAVIMLKTAKKLLTRSGV